MSNRSLQIPEAISVKFNQLVYEKKRSGIDVITLSLGEAFFDILKGNTKTSCDTGFGCTNGWDPVTGFGRPIFNGMLKHFGNDD